MPEFRLQLSDAAAVVSYLKASEDQPMEWLASVSDIDGLSAAAPAALATLRAALEGFDAKSKPWIVLAKVLLDRTRIAAGISQSTDVAVRARGVAIWQFMNFVRVQPAAADLPISRLLDRIRRLVLLADERDLRELPAAARGIDAVGLMTVHGSKGLEFPAVHIPGMNSDTLPRSPNQVRACAPPDKMVEGVPGTGIEVLKAGHVEEQECLFFVDLLIILPVGYPTRARTCSSPIRGSASPDRAGIPIAPTRPTRLTGDRGSAGRDTMANGVPTSTGSTP
jgi:superfamily I DNA/RNA helicase